MYTLCIKISSDKTIGVCTTLVCLLISLRARLIVPAGCRLGAHAHPSHSAPIQCVAVRAQVFSPASSGRFGRRPSRSLSSSRRIPAGSQSLVILALNGAGRPWSRGGALGRGIGKGSAAVRQPAVGPLIGGPACVGPTCQGHHCRALNCSGSRSQPNSPMAFDRKLMEPRCHLLKFSA